MDISVIGVFIASVFVVFFLSRVSDSDESLLRDFRGGVEEVSMFWSFGNKGIDSVDAAAECCSETVKVECAALAVIDTDF